MTNLARAKCRRVQLHCLHLVIFANERPQPTDLLSLLTGSTSDQQWFSAKEVGAIIGRTDQFVRDLLDNQKLLGHSLQARGASLRKCYQIPRHGLELYLLETANYSGDDYCRHILQLIRRLPRPYYEKICQALIRNS